MNKTVFSEELSSGFDAIPMVLNGAVAALVNGGLIDPREECRFRLCIEEALVNAIRHGNHGDASLKVGIEIIDYGDCCKIRVRDEGPGFSPEDVSMPDCEQMGGRGVCLIRHFMDRVEFNMEERCLEMTFSLSRGE